MPVRLSLNLPPKLSAALEQLADDEGITKTEVIRNALSTERYLRDRYRKGWSIFLRGPDGTLERMVVPYWGDAQDVAGLAAGEEVGAPGVTAPSSEEAAGAHR